MIDILKISRIWCYKFSVRQVSFFW